MVLLYGRAGRLTAENGGLRPAQQAAAARDGPHGTWPDGRGPPNANADVFRQRVNLHQTSAEARAVYNPYRSQWSSRGERYGLW